MKNPTLIVSVLFLAIIIASSTVFFKHVEGWGWIDSYFFTVVTLSTVGYGNLVPVTPFGKIAATILIFTGIGAFAFAIQQFGMYAVRKQQDHRGWLYRHLPHPEEDEDPSKEK